MNGTPLIFRLSGSGRLVPGMASLLVVASLAPCPAVTFTVSNTSDSGNGSLRQAILSANANSGLDTITFQISGA